jgi:hypothetical protein
MTPRTLSLIFLTYLLFVAGVVVGHELPRYKQSCDLVPWRNQ